MTTKSTESIEAPIQEEDAPEEAAVAPRSGDELDADPAPSIDLDHVEVVVGGAVGDRKVLYKNGYAVGVVRCGEAQIVTRELAALLAESGLI